MRREIQNIPSRKKQLMDSATDRRSALSSAEERLKHVQASIKQLDVEVGGLKDQILRYRQQQNEVRTNDEYRALEHEIAGCERQISEAEDRELQYMEDMDRVNAEVSSMRSTWDDAVRAADAESAQMDAQGAELAARLAETEATRTAAAQQVPADWLSRYERIFNHRGDRAIVPIKSSAPENSSAQSSGVCGGCHTTLPPQTINDARLSETNGRIAVCAFCGRMLYV
ncbi:MAG: hypothetical protein KBA51_01480 [Kiritimatiellae bacterium]|nr:hypothetical protein [Kiritimatiellia bacterium]